MNSLHLFAGIGGGILADLALGNAQVPLQAAIAFDSLMKRYEQEVKQ